jgi:hypothetical protein
LLGASSNSLWLGVIGAFALIQCWSGLQQARILSRMAAAPHHAGVACPSCHAAPPAGDFWVCGHCRNRFDMFSCRGTCPHCGAVFDGVRCLECGQLHRVQEYFQD